MKLVVAAAVTFLLILCGWFAVWPLYEWMVGIRPWFTFVSQNQMLLFGFGVLLFVPVSLMGRKIMI